MEVNDIMVCQECKKRQASVHFTKIVNGEKMELKLCEVCAKERGDLDLGHGEHFSFHKLLAGLLDIDELQVMGEQEMEKATCNNCGLSEHSFVNSGRLGCSECYNTFGFKLDPLLKRIQGGSSHVGKVPVRAGGKIRIKREMQNLRDKLNMCIAKEDFEQAAIIRDQIKELEKKAERRED